MHAPLQQFIEWYSAYCYTDIVFPLSQQAFYIIGCHLTRCFVLLVALNSFPRRVAWPPGSYVRRPSAVVVVSVARANVLPAARLHIHVA